MDRSAIFARIVPLASWARTGPRRSPSISASIIARPDLVAIEEATESILIPASCNVAEPGDLADPLLDDLGTVADHVPGGLDLRRGDEAARQQPALQQVRQPLRVGVVRFAARHVLDVRGVADQDLLEVPVLDQGVVDRHAVDPGRLHRYVRDPERDQPPGGLAHHPVKRPERPLDGDPAIGPVTWHPHRDRDLVLADVDRRAALVHDMHARLLSG